MKFVWNICRRLILSGLLCLFSFWASGPFVTSFEFGPRTLSVFILFKSFESFWISYLLCIYFVFNCSLSLNVMFVFVRSCRDFRIYSCHFIYLIMFRNCLFFVWCFIFYVFLCLIVFNFINVMFVIRYFRICVLHFSNVVINVFVHCVISYLIAFHILNISYLIMTRI